jgi:hypothetical protein
MSINAPSFAEDHAIRYVRTALRQAARGTPSRLLSVLRARRTPAIQTSLQRFFKTWLADGAAANAAFEHLAVPGPSADKPVDQLRRTRRQDTAT